MYSLLTDKRIHGPLEERVPEVFLKPSGQVIRDVGVEVVTRGFWAFARTPGGYVSAAESPNRLPSAKCPIKGANARLLGLGEL